MLIRPQLAQFYQNKTTQKSVAQNTYRSMQKWKNNNKDKRYVIAQAEDASSVDKAIEIIKPLYDDLSWLYDMISGLCKIQQNNVFANIELRSSKSGFTESLLLHQGSKIALYLTIIKKQKNSVATSSHIFGPDTIINTLVKANNAVLQRATLSKDGNIKRDDKPINNHDGQYYVYDNRHESINITAYDYDVILLRTVFKRKAYANIGTNNLQVHHFQEFLPHSDKAIMTTADESASRAQFMFSILRQSQYKKAISIFKQWLNEDLSYDMRWYIMREFLALDIESALPLLIEMASNDPHPEVRQTASSTLQYIRNQYPQLFENEKQYATIN